MTTQSNLQKICIVCRRRFDVSHKKWGRRGRARVDNKMEVINTFCNQVLLASGGKQKDANSRLSVSTSTSSEETVSSTSIPLNFEVVMLCDKCSPVMKDATDANTIVENIERKVRTMQLQLLKELKILQEQLSLFYEAMAKIKGLMENGEIVSGPDVSLMGCAGIQMFEKRMEQVISKLYKNGINEMTDCKTSINSFILKSSKNAREQDLETCSVNHDPVAATSIKSEMESDEETDCFFHQPDKGTEIHIGVGEQENDLAGSMDDGGSDADGDYISDGEDNNDSGSRKLDIPLLRRKIAKSINTSVDFEGMSAFKKQVIIHVLRRKEHILQIIPLRKSRYAGCQVEDPWYKYFMDYNPEVDTFSVEDVSIVLGDGVQGNFLECSKCLFRAQEEDRHKRKSEIHVRMLDHIMGKHLNAFQCSQCNYTAISHYNYLRHLKWHSSGNVICDICEKPLRRKQDLKKHKWLHMNKEEKEQAIQSGRKQPQSSLKKKRETDTPRPFQCSVCGKAFFHRCHMQRHEMCHQSREERMIVCQICGKSIMPHSLYSHKLICKPLGAAPSPPVKCIYTDCQRSFSTLQLMKDHFKRNHSDEWQQQQRNQHKCPICGKGFCTNCEMVKHMVSHSNERPYACSKGCQGKFKTIRVCTNHEKLCTGSGTRPGPKNGKRKPKLK